MTFSLGLFMNTEPQGSGPDIEMPDVGPMAVAINFPWPALLYSRALAVGAILLLVPLAHRTGWIDRPDVRKTHDGEVPHSPD